MEKASGLQTEGLWGLFQELLNGSDGKEKPDQCAVI